MRKLLIVSVCLFASLMANADVRVMKTTDGLADSIIVSGALTEDQVKNVQGSLKRPNGSTIVKLVTEGNYELTSNDWGLIIKGWDADELIQTHVATLDMSETHSEEDAMSELGNAINGHHPAMKNLIWSRYNNVPEGCFNGKSNINFETITILDKKKADDPDITIGKDAFNGLQKLKKLTIGNSVVALGEQMCIGCKSLETVTFNTPKVKVIPGNAFQSCKSLKLIDLPSNLEKIDKGAFEYCSLETISFPSTLTTICENAFHQCYLMYVVIPENVTTIESEAFQDNYQLTDVYVMGPNVKCGMKAFAKNQIIGDFSNKDSKGNVIKDKDGNVIGTAANPASRENWKTGNDPSKYLTPNPAVLHFAANANARSRYQNPYFTMINTDGILERIKKCDGNEAEKKKLMEDFHILNFPWNLLYYAKDHNQTCPFAYYSYKGENGETKSVRIWIDDNGKYSDESENTEALFGENAAYWGWRQFQLIQDDVKQITFDDEHRVDDRWYSMCFPFDMNANQIRTAYGAGTEVCEFIGAWNTNEKNSEGKEMITFRYKPLLNNECNAALNGKEETRGASPIITRANKAYMIHPASKKVTDQSDIWHRIIPGIPMDQQVGNQDLLIETDPYQYVDEIKKTNHDYEDDTMLPGFIFKGNYNENVKLPANCYHFAYLNHADGSRTLILNHLTKESQKYNWTPMTALVLDTQQKGASAKYFNTFSFNDNKMTDETTGISEIKTNEQVSYQNNNLKIYNINGQVVREGTNFNGLEKGIYILNGKKYIIK